MIRIACPKLIGALADDVREGSLIVEIGACDLVVAFALARRAQGLAVLADEKSRAELRRIAAEAGIADRIAIANAIAVPFASSGAYYVAYADADEETLVLDAFGVERRVCLIRVAAPAATQDFVHALSPTLLQRDAPALCMQGVDAALDDLSGLVKRFGYSRAGSADSHALFRQSAVASARLRDGGDSQDRIAESVAQKLLPQLASLIEQGEERILERLRPALARAAGAEPGEPLLEASGRRGQAPPALEASRFIRSAPVASRATLNHVEMDADAIGRWRADGKVERVSDEGAVFVAAGRLHLTSPSFAVDPDAFYSLAIRMRLPTSAGLIRAYVMDDAVDIAVVCRDLRPGGADEVLISAEFRSLHRSKTLHIRIDLPEAKAGDRCVIVKAQLSHVGATKRLAALESGLALDLPAASMATVTGREDMLLDAVSGLYRQCSKIRIFLNGHTNLPSYFDDPRIELAWSSDHGDMGDTGKFFWAESGAKGPRLVVDDDFIFPADFAERIVAKLRRYDRRALVGVHGILLRQPLLKNYYDPASRYVRRYVIGMGADMPVHAVGTGAVCYDPDAFKLTLNDFPFNNMADVWVMLAAQRQQIPIVAAARPHNWLIDNRTSKESDSIWKASSTGANSRFNTATMQSHVARGAWPITLQRRKSAGAVTSKALLLVEAMQDLEPAATAIEAWRGKRPQNYTWVVAVVAAQQQTERALHDWLGQSELPFETHVIGPDALKRPVTASDLIETLRAIDHDVGVCFSAGVSPKDMTWRLMLHEARQGDLVEMRLGAAGGETLALGWSQTTLVELLHDMPEDQAERDWKEALLACAETQKRRSVSSIRAEDALTIAEILPPAGRLAGPVRGAQAEGLLLRDRRALWRDRPGVVRLNDVAERVFLLNLDRRPDRLAAFTAQAEAVGLEFERFAALDGAKEPQLSEWTAYMKQPLTRFPRGTGPFEWEWDLYNNYFSDTHRIAHYEHKLRRKVVSRGAWGYQKSIIEIIGRAVEADWESVLIFDDDCRFHRDLVRLFDRRIREAPPDWMMLNLGALQYAWEDKWVEWRGEGFYHCMGSSVGSHALLLHREAYPAVMSRALRMDLPFDTGALHSVKRKYAQQCLVMFPNLFIQDVGDSDIGDSDAQMREGGKAENAYRWHLPDYHSLQDVTALSQARPLETA